MIGKGRQNMRAFKPASIVLSALLVVSCVYVNFPRPSNWALPIQVDGVPNLHKVSDFLYRSAQPTEEGFKRLEVLGVKTVVSLRRYHSDIDLMKNTSLKYISVPMVAWSPDEESIVLFLRTVGGQSGDLDSPTGEVGSPTKSPVLVHCLHGADRTGVAVAMYRVAVQGWDKDEALAEMTDGGFGFHYVWWNLVWWVKGLDVEKIKFESGLNKY